VPIEPLIDELQISKTLKQCINYKCIQDNKNISKLIYYVCNSLYDLIFSKNLNILTINYLLFCKLHNIIQL